MTSSTADAHAPAFLKLFTQFFKFEFYASVEQSLSKTIVIYFRRMSLCCIFLFDAHKVSYVWTNTVFQSI